jgi:23S rRNA pseudouridine2605 synthase
VASKPVQHRSLIYNKPEGEVTTRSDPDGRPTVFDNLPSIRNARWVAVGRLDINTTGLLLLTTDGELAHAMMHPSSNVDREYACRIRGQVAAEQLENLRRGVELEDGPASFSDIQEAGGSGENHWFHVTIMEGRNREVRRLWQSQGLAVSRLKRVRYGAAFLPKRLHMGRWSEISPRDHEILREDVGLQSTGSSLSLQFVKGPGSRSGGTASKKAKKTGKKSMGRK